MSLHENMSLSLSYMNIFNSFVKPPHIKLHIDFTSCLSFLDLSPRVVLAQLSSNLICTRNVQHREKQGKPLLSSHGKEDKTAITRPSSTISKIGWGSLSLALIFSINPRASLFSTTFTKRSRACRISKELIAQHVAIAISFHIYSRFYFLLLKKCIILILFTITISYHDRYWRWWCWERWC